MKKIFLFLSAVLVSLAMQATLVTKDYNLSDLSKQQESTTWSSNTVTVTNEWDGVAHDYGEYPYNAEDYSELTLELASVSEVGVYINVTYSDDVKSEKTIAAGSLIGRIALSSSAIKRIDVKLTAAGSATLSKLYFSKVIGKETVTNLFTGTKTFNWNWEDRILIPNTAFASIHEGDRIQFTYTSVADGQCQVRVQESNAELAETGEYAAITQNQAEPATFSFVLRAEDIEKIQANGLYFHGNKYTITSIDLYTYAQQIMVETELNSGAEVIDWDQHWVHTSGLPTLAAGDELRITVSAVESGQYWQVHFRHDDGGEDAITFGSSDETTPKVYSFALSAEQASNINATGKLLIAGANVTLSRFAIAQPMSIYDERIIWSGEHVVGSWNALNISASEISSLKAGNIICIQIAELSRESEDNQVLLQHSYTNFDPNVQYRFAANNAVAPMTLEIPVTAKMRDELRNQNLTINGLNYTISHVIIKEGTPVTTSSKFLSVSSAGMATLVVPFNVQDLPDGVEAYTLTNNGDETIWATEVDALEADKPVLIVAAEGEYEFISEEGASDDISGKTGTYENGALIGTYQTINPLAENDGAGNNNFILQDGTDGVAFYQVKDNSCSINPYRAYLSCGYNPPAPAPGASAPKMRIVFHNDSTTGIESQELKANSQKLIKNGQLLIIRDGHTFNAFGIEVK